MAGIVWLPPLPQFFRRERGVGQRGGTRRFVPRWPKGLVETSNPERGTPRLPISRCALCSTDAAQPHHHHTTTLPKPLSGPLLEGPRTCRGRPLQALGVVERPECGPGCATGSAAWRLDGGQRQPSAGRRAPLAQMARDAAVGTPSWAVPRMRRTAGLDEPSSAPNWFPDTAPLPYPGRPGAELSVQIVARQRVALVQTGTRRPCALAPARALSSHCASTSSRAFQSEPWTG